MRNVILFLGFITLSLSSYSQHKKTKKRPVPLPPPALNLIVLSTDTLSLQEGGMPILFEWEMNADTTLKPNTVFKKLIRLTYGETEVNGTYSLQSIRLRKTKGNNKFPVPEIPKVIKAINYYSVDLANGILNLKGGDGTVMRLKVGYNKNKQLSYLQDLNDKTIYRHIASDEPLIGLPPNR